MKTKYFGIIAILALAFTVCALPVYANLVPTTFGFPVIVQNGSTSAFNQDTANATDFEAININFPPSFDGVNLGPTILNGAISTGTPTCDPSVSGTATANVLPFGPVNLAFPDINQVVDQTQAVTHTDFSQTNEYAEFSYPFVGVGGVSLPGFGFGF
jgi:hypothetical protein